MAVRVGPKGQVVINKQIRDYLGVQPGWRAFQILVDDHVEIYFVPPEHNESLAGTLAPYLQTSIPSGEAWDQARALAWEEAARESEKDRRAASPGDPPHDPRR
jgi:bifunctional DNA-binding transcriptional regulator/antitoxin component of YhaV-PrlF toxin-antitoxin module